VAGLSDADGRLAFVASTADSPGEIFVHDAGGERRLTSLFETALPDVRLVEPSPRTFRAPDGTEIEGWVLRGDATGPTPLLLDVHGGPHNAWGPVFDGVHLWHHTLVAEGWTVLFIDPRGTDGYGERFPSGVGPGAWGTRAAA